MQNIVKKASSCFINYTLGKKFMKTEWFLAIVYCYDKIFS